MSISSSMVRNLRKTLKIFPHVRRIDTLSAEYPAYTNYLYLSYHADRHDIDYERDGRSVVVLGSGVYRIGSSVEFDWCCVNTLKVLHSEGYRSIMINCNPETVSTDFDECDRLYFEELTLERVLDILELETPKGTIVSMGGQISNNLAFPLHKNKQRILGSLATSIDEVEDRYKFSKALDILGIEQPLWKEFSNLNDIQTFISEVGYPILIRPSYVLSGSGMNVIFNVEELRSFFYKLETISSEHSVVISKFIENAKEIELDAVAHQGNLIYHAVSEHIEFAGLHSGDATLVYPTQNIYLSTLQEIYRISKQIAQYFHLSGPFNIQFIYKNNIIQVIECNLRASRSFPFISKVSGFNLIRLATEVMLGKLPNPCGIFFSFNYIGVKVSYFSFSRLPGTDPVLGVDMVSTGEVGCLGNNFYEALIKAMLSAGFSVPVKQILISVEISSFKEDFINPIKLLVSKGYKLFSTEEIYPFLMDYGLTSKLLSWPGVHHLPNVFDYIRKKKISFIINIPKKKDSEIDNNYTLRRSAVDFNIPLLTNTSLAKAYIRAFCKEEPEELTIAEWKSYLTG